MPTLRRQFHLFVAALMLGGLLAGAAPAAGARFESFAPIKRLQALQLAREPLEHRRERREKAERQRELRRLAERMKKSGQTSLRVKGEKARRDERREALPAAAEGVFGNAVPQQAEGLLPANRRANNPGGDNAGDGQCETSIVAWNQYMVAAWNDGKGFHDGSDQYQGYATSADGGVTWTDRGTFPLPASRPNWSWTSDPVLGVNSRTGAFYFSALVDPDGPSGNTNGIGVVKGRFSGSTIAWETPSLVRSVDYSTDFLDKQWIAVDPNNGRVYLSYTRFASSVSEINFQAADSALSAWSSPLLLSVTSNNASLDERGLVQGSRPAVGPDGTVYVMYYRIGEVDVDLLRLARSTNLGGSFSTPSTILTFYPNFASGGPGFNRAMGIQFASIATDLSGGEFDGRLHLTWAESLNWFDELGTLGLAGNKNEIEPNNTSGTATAFTSGQTLRGVISSAAGEEDWFQVTLGAGESIVFMTDSIAVTTSFSMRVFGPDGASRLLYTLASSLDILGGFGPAFPFTAPTAGNYYFRVLPTAGAGAYRVRTGPALQTIERGRDQRDAFASWSPDRGATWSAPVRVSDSAPGYDDWLPEIAVTADGHVYSGWFDFRDSPGATGGAVSRFYTARSDDGGATWQGSTMLSDAGSPWSTVNTNIMPNQGDYNSLFGYDRGVVGCWADGRNGDPDAYMAQWDATAIAHVTSSTVTDSTVTLEWTGRAGVGANVISFQRRSLPGGPWQTMLEQFSSWVGNWSASFTDTAVVPNARYAYRLGIPVDGRERFYGLAEVAMPSGPSLALALTGVYPNPVDRAAGSAPRVAFVLSGTAPAQLQLMDISGRLVATYELGSPGPGPHQFALPAGGDIRPGIYLLRLVQGSQDVSRRISILR